MIMMYLSTAEYLSMNSIHLFMTLVGGLINFLPLFIGAESYMEDSIYATSIKEEPYKDSNIFILGLLSPLVIDTVLDIFSSLYDGILESKRKHNNMDEKKKKTNKKQSTLVGSVLNNGETVVFIIGMIILPLSALLPDSTQKLALISLCCREAAITLLGGTFMCSLTRYFNGTERTIACHVTEAVIVFLCIGNTIGTFDNNLVTEKVSSLPLFLTAIGFQYSAAALVLGCCFYWLAWNVFQRQAKFIRGLVYIMRQFSSSVHLDQQRSPAALEKINDQDSKAEFGTQDSVTFFRAVHITTAIFYIIVQGSMQSSFKTFNNVNGIQTMALSTPIILLALSILIRTMRQIKVAAFDNLVSTCIQ